MFLLFLRALIVTCCSLLKICLFLFCFVLFLSLFLLKAGVAEEECVANGRNAIS